MSTRLFQFLIVSLLLSVGIAIWNSTQSHSADKPLITVVSCQDFEVNGKGDSSEWSKTDWVEIPRRGKSKVSYNARVKMLYSTTGIYLLFDGSDEILTATHTADFENLWKEDVFECFFWPDETHPIYFEYEVSPLGKELPLLVPNFEGKQLGWIPWHYEGDRKVKKAISIRGGEQKSLAKIAGWTAEVFIPYKLLKPLQNVPPTAGKKWRANFYRIDHDNKNVTGWEWAPISGNTYHDIKNFGTIEFK